MTTKSKKFNRVLVDAKHALESIDIPFHLHSGTALGAHREHDFIEHDNDIDLAVFYKDVHTKKQVDDIIFVMEEHGFELLSQNGTLKRGYELQFNHTKKDVDLDIFWIYEGTYRDKEYYILSSYFSQCDEMKYRTCVWAYRPYKPVRINFLGHTYDVMPIQTLVDAYGKDWMTPKKFNYEQGLNNGYKSLIRDYYEPRPTDNKIAFCFLLYDTVVHSKQWINFFNQDKYPVQSYSIYTHLKKISDRTQEWVKDHHIRAIKTGWCEENLVWAWIRLLTEALKDPDNKYFVVLSGECIPLFGFWETYKKITSSKKSRININSNAESTVETGLKHADQWVILNRKHAKKLVELHTTEEGKEFVKYLRKKIDRFCPDEIYPIEWFIDQYGKKSSESFKKEFRIVQTTWTYWDNIHSSPRKLNSPKMTKMKAEICKSDALFARKFNKKAAGELSGTCGY